jgi:hypothetical protein
MIVLLCKFQIRKKILKRKMEKNLKNIIYLKKLRRIIGMECCD